MWTCPRSSRPRPAWTTCSVPAIMLFSALSAGCSRQLPSGTLLSEQCLAVNGQREITLSIPAPASGALQVQIEERGLTLVSRLDDSQTADTASPVERFGTIVLLTSTLGGRSHVVRIRAHDSPDMQGEFCLRARLLSRGDPALLQGEAAFARAGQATQQEDWQAA